MTDPKKYKAFISYSHRDEKTAIWLHRTLESYRLPRKLVGTDTPAGKVPTRIRPVFRDRDDLSSAADLSETVEQALSASENMIVVCSPEAAASRWVNEEIRRFASLGRQDRVFCVIVDGDPASSGEDACFPPALREIGLHEPLAADIRKWADGKRLSRLKLVAGMLGLPLDTLRRRDLQKRQRVWLMTTIAAITAVAVLITAITARIAAEQRRDSGESLVAYKLNELRTMLNLAEDPENLARLSQWGSAELTDLVEEAGDGENALYASAMDKRDQGIELWEKGSLTEAMDQFRESWALLAISYRDERSNRETFFELGQAEFYIGQTYLDQGDLAAAEEAFTAYAEITRRLITLEPKNAEWVLEMAFALSNLGSLQKSKDESMPERTLQFMQSSLEYNQIALVLDPSNTYYQSELGQSHAFLASAQLNVCDVEGAVRARHEHVKLDSDLLAEDPDNIEQIQKAAFALTGLATAQDFSGNVDEAIANLDKALILLKKNASVEVGGRDIKVDILLRQGYQVELMIQKGELARARQLAQEVSEAWQALESITSEDMRTSLIYIQHLLNLARLSALSGNEESAIKSLHEIRVHLLASRNNMTFSRKAGNMLVEAAFYHWELSGEVPDDNIQSGFPDYDLGQGWARACMDAGSAVQMAIMRQQHEKAKAFADYLLENGYRQIGFIRVCEQYGLCSRQ